MKCVKDRAAADYSPHSKGGQGGGARDIASRYSFSFILFSPGHLRSDPLDLSWGCLRNRRPIYYLPNSVPLSKGAELQYRDGLSANCRPPAIRNMGRDAVGIVTGVEKAFGLQIPDEDYEAAGHTVGSLCDYLMKRLPNFKSEEVWIRLQGIVSEELCIPRDEIQPSSRWVEDLRVD